MALTLQGGVTKNVVSAGAGGLSGAGAGALAGSVVPGIGTAVGALAGGILGAGSSLLGNLLGGNSGSNSAIDLNIKDLYNMEMYNTIKDLYFMNVQDQYNRGSMRYQTDLQRELNEQQFNHNRWFVQNAYQNSVNDLRRAGLNPILAAGNGGNVGSVSGGSASALGVSQGSHGTDIASMLSSSASSSQAAVAKRQLALNAIDTVGDIFQKYATSSKALQEAETQESVRAVNTARAALDTVKSERERIHKELDEKYADKDRLLQQEAVINGIETNTLNVLNNRIHAYANLKSAGAAETSANALSETQKEEARIKRARADWIADHPWQYGFQQTLESLGSVGLLGVGAGLGKGHEAFKAHQAKKEAKNPSKVGTQYMKRSF